jgi:uncharacterized protein (TIGR00730 family)
MTPLSRLCVFCASSPGVRPAYAGAARQLGELLAERRIELVYGGGRVGLMGVLADAVLANGGHVIGVIPQALMDLEVGHTGLPDLRIVGSMHERKALMADLSDGFIAMPGGIGTLEEFFEVLTWAQLGFHAKPCGLLDVEGFFPGLLRFLDHAVEERFLRPQHRALVMTASDATALLTAMENFVVPAIDKWIDREER